VKGRAICGIRRCRRVVTSMSIKPACFVSMKERVGPAQLQIVVRGGVSVQCCIGAGNVDSNSSLIYIDAMRIRRPLLVRPDALGRYDSQSASLVTQPREHCEFFPEW